MTFIRPDLAAAIYRLREVLLTGVIGLLGLWLITRGGLVLVHLGLIILALAATLIRHALARLRFHQAVGAPGIVELDEAQLAYMGPQIGGFISLQEASELRLITMQGRRMWRVKQADGQAMLVPVDAEGAGQLFDAFAALPGMDVTALAAAAAGKAPEQGAQGTGAQEIALPGPQMSVIWRRAGKAGLTANGK